MPITVTGAKALGRPGSSGGPVSQETCRDSEETSSGGVPRWCACVGHTTPISRTRPLGLCPQQSGFTPMIFSSHPRSDPHSQLPLSSYSPHKMFTNNIHQRIEYGLFLAALGLLGLHLRLGRQSLRLGLAHHWATLPSPCPRPGQSQAGLSRHGRRRARSHRAGDRGKHGQVVAKTMLLMESSSSPSAWRS